MSEPFDSLFAAASQARAHAYAPYSRFAVGAAAIDEEGRVFAGCNVENAAYPQGQCAEATTIGMMVAGGGSRIVEMLVIGGEPGDGLLCTPCGGCRQRIREFAAPETPVHICGPEGLRRTASVDELLPYSFGPDNLGHRA
ncbi:MAG: cytidine deaminase [Inquilinus sp.]|nr:cytidine deaminase [Inquilinus sp.]